jgi:hypothetical protein
MAERRPPTATSENEAESGCVAARVGALEQRLSDAVAWREDGLYVIRSTEFDLMAEDEDFAGALDIFTRRVFDYAAMLADLVSSGEATDGELAVFSTVSARVVPLAQALEQETRRLRLPRLRTQRSGHWRRRATPANGSSRLFVA